MSDVVVLDPYVQANMLDAETVRARAELLAVDNNFHLTTLGALNSRDFSPFVGENQRPNPQTSVLNIASVNCIPILMADKQGRASTHIAGEVCRIVTETVNVAESWGIEELKQFVEIIKGLKNEGVKWRYEGLDYKFPTIDGGIAIPKNVLADEPGYVDVLNSLHFDWLKYFIHTLLPQNRKVTKVVPPFKLNSGRKITDNSLHFYATP